MRTTLVLIALLVLGGCVTTIAPVPDRVTAKVTSASLYDCADNVCRSLNVSFMISNKSERDLCLPYRYARHMGAGIRVLDSATVSIDYFVGVGAHDLYPDVPGGERKFIQALRREPMERIAGNSTSAFDLKEENGYETPTSGARAYLNVVIFDCESGLPFRASDHTDLRA